MLPSLSVGRDELIQYGFEKYPIVGKKLSKQHGLLKNMAWGLFETSHFHSSDLSQDKSPFKHITFRESDYRFHDAFLGKAFKLMEKRTTHEVFRLGLFDLLQLDFDTFTILEEKINEMERLRNKAMNDFNPEKLTKQK